MILGIDIGTQSLKAVVFDGALGRLGAAATPYRPTFPRPGWAEQDPRLWEAALAPTIALALADAGRSAGEVRAIGIAGQLDGCIAVDGRGAALTPCILWMDRRADAEIAGLPADRVRALSGATLDPGHMAAKLRWLRRHAVGDRRDVRFHQPVSFMVERLTGRAVFDHALASTSMLYGIARRDFDEELLRLFDVAADELPALAEATDTAGPLTVAGGALAGLPPGIPVAVGTGDDFASALGAGVAAPGPVVVALGTGEVVGAVHGLPLVDGGGLVETHAFPGGACFVENPGWLAGGAVAWFLGVFGIADAARLDALAAEAPPGAAGVTFLPALAGAMAPAWVPSARGCFYGLTPSHGVPHLARALLEGCAFAMRDVIDRLGAMGVATAAIRLAGGGARSRLWAQIRADLTGLPVEIVAEPDVSPTGAAVLAAVAAGLQSDLAAAAALVGNVATTILPDAAAGDAYRAAYRRYRDLFDSLRPMFDPPAGAAAPGRAGA